jgi:hypothetical protein
MPSFIRPRYFSNGAGLRVPRRRLCGSFARAGLAVSDSVDRLCLPREIGELRGGIDDADSTWLFSGIMRLLDLSTICCRPPKRGRATVNTTTEVLGFARGWIPAGGAHNLTRSESCQSDGVGVANVHELAADPSMHLEFISYVRHQARSCEAPSGGCAISARRVKSGIGLTQLT